MKKFLAIILPAFLLVLASAHAEEERRYTCPMHPHYIATDPQGGCPICGMDLVPVAGDGGAPGGRAGAIVVAPAMLQTMGVRTAAVDTASFSRIVRAYGNVEPNTRREAVSASRLEGWIEDLAVTAEGDTVAPGQLLYRVFSPDLVAAQKDFLAALKIGAETRVNASEQRLRSLGMQRSAIAALRKSRTILERTPVYAEAGGVVQALEARNGTYVKPGDPVLRLQSYADVWIIASVAEQDLPQISSGLAVELQFPSAPGALRGGKVDYVYPTIDPDTRTSRVRIIVGNEDGALRPGAFADVRFNVTPGDKLSVPSEAVLRDGRGAHVIASLGDGRFATRQVTTGVTASGRTEILSGLEAGERVVVSGQFMLDSEANLREGFAKFSAPRFGADTPLSELPLDAEALALIDHFVDAALYFHEALRDRYDIDPYFLDPAISAGEILRARFPDTQLIPIVDGAQSALAAAKDAKSGDGLREQLAGLMTALEPWLMGGAPTRYDGLGLSLYRETGSGRLWIEEGGDMGNPYGAADAIAIDWPDPMASAVDAQGRSETDPHAGHQ